LQPRGFLIFSENDSDRRMVIVQDELALAGFPLMVLLTVVSQAIFLYLR
jgi:hypothetical protein